MFKGSQWKEGIVSKRKEGGKDKKTEWLEGIHSEEGWGRIEKTRKWNPVTVSVTSGKTGRKARKIFWQEKKRTWDFVSRNWIHFSLQGKEFEDTLFLLCLFFSHEESKWKEKKWWKKIEERTKFKRHDKNYVQDSSNYTFQLSYSHLNQGNPRLFISVGHFLVLAIYFTRYWTLDNNFKGDEKFDPTGNHPLGSD